MSYIMNFLLMLSFSSNLLAQVIRYQGVAKEKGVVVYREQHTHEYSGDKIIKSETIYLDPEGNEIGRLNSTYNKSLTIPEHVMVDKRAKNTHGIKYLKSVPNMFSIDDGEKEKLKVFDENEKNRLSVAGQGLHFYMLTHLEDLKKKKQQDLKFLIPGRLDSYNFTLKFIKQENDLYHFDVEIDQWFLRLFAPKLVLIYNTKTKKLVKYSGLSNLKNTKGDLFNVDISYE